jgi:hypothetical protein
MSGQTTAPTPLPSINGKPWYTSKTLWFNGLCAMLAVAEMNFKLLEGRIPGGFYTWMAFVLPVGNALLRIITTTALIMPRVEQPAPQQAGFISASLVQWLGIAALMAFGLWLIFDAGRDVNEAKWLKKESARLQVEQAEKDRIAKLGQHAAAYEIQEQIRAAERQAHLTGVMQHARSQFPLVTGYSRGSVSAAIDPHLVCAGGVRQPVDQLAGAAPAPEKIVVVPVPSDPDAELTLGAVWLWNAALTGQTDRAADSCRVDGATGQADPACAQPSGLDLDAAFANHAANAASCAADRARHQRLIDYLNSLSPTLLSK